MFLTRADIIKTPVYHKHRVNMNTAAICLLVLLIHTLSSEGKSLNSDRDSNSGVTSLSTELQQTLSSLGNETSSSSSPAKKNRYKFRLWKAVASGIAWAGAEFGVNKLIDRFG
ncbi:hypothetical protein OESDEN_18959 [Oesophagostomum dentatum]|uniref:Uncharacterized protein n=1 Tax=Oesophagostomum dentatum TaxID=61180 RepID=A0A0B1SDQ1_OESDE|nr:hypothetical protein OESDEN_18959 [Oesophagostomum dentatum]